MRKKETRLDANETGTPITTCATTLSGQSRVCSQCGRLSAAGDMAPKRSICKGCLSENKRRWYADNKTRVSAQQLQYRAANPGRVWAKHHRARARRFGLDLVTDHVTRQEIVARWGDRCVYCKSGPFEVADHVITVRAGGPHTIWNLVPACKPCNARKRWTVDRAWIAYWFSDKPSKDAGSGPSDAASAT